MSESSVSNTLIVVVVRRYAARLLDLIIFYALWAVVLLGIAYLMGQTVMPTMESAGYITMGLALLGFPLALFFEGVWYRFFGATPGKRLFELCVADLRGKPLTSSQYNARLWRVLFSGVFFYVPILGYLMACVQGACLLNRGSTTYDEGKYLVLAYRPSVFKIICWVVLSAGFIAGMNSMDTIAMYLP